MKKRLLIVSLLLIAFAIIGTGFTTRETRTASALNPNLTITSTGKIKVSPDVAYINFSIETKHKSLENAQNENSLKTQKFVAALKKQGINENEIKTQGFFIYPEYDYNAGQKFTGYRVTHQFKVTVSKIEELGKIIDAATASGANIVMGIEMSLSNGTEKYNEALVMAVNSAKEKALMLCKAAGAKNIKVVSLKEFSYNGYIGFDRISYTKAFDNIAGGTTILGGDMEISASIEMTYELVF